MKKTIVVLLSLAFLLSFSSCTKSKAKLSGDTKLIPAGTNAIAEINFADVMKLEKVKKQMDEESKKFTEMTGVKPSDVTSITLFANVDKLRDLERKPDFGFLIKGKGFTKDIFKKVPKSFKQIKHADTVIYNMEKMAVALAGKTVVGGTIDNAKKVLDLSKGKGKAVDTKEFTAIFKKLNASSAKAAVVLPESTRKELVKMASSVPLPVAGLSDFVSKLKVISAGANISSSSVEFKMVIKSDAKAIKLLVPALNALLPMVGDQADKADKKMKGAKKAFDSIKLVADGDYFVASVKIPESLIDQMK